MSIIKVVPQVKEKMSIIKVVPQVKEKISIIKVVPQVKEKMSIIKVVPQEIEKMSLIKVVPQAKEKISIIKVVPQVKEKMSIIKVVPQVKERKTSACCPLSLSSQIKSMNQSITTEVMFTISAVHAIGIEVPITLLLYVLYCAIFYRNCLLYIIYHKHNISNYNEIYERQQ